MILKLFEENPNEKDVLKVVDVLKNGGIIVYPTDTIYGIGCAITNARAVERVAQIKQIPIEKSNFSFICSDLSHLSDYTRPIDNSTFKLMRRLLPGPYTFVLNANNQVPKYFKRKKKTVGIRVPANQIILEIVRQLGNPILSTSVHDDDEVLEYMTDPELIYERLKNSVDLVVDGGFGGNRPSTVIDCTGEEPQLLRSGKGSVDF